MQLSMQRPYAHRPVGWFGFTHRIYFEETAIREVPAGAADSVCELANAAYNTGFNSGYVAATVEKEGDKK